MQKSASQIVLKPSPKAIKTTPKMQEDNSSKTKTAEIRSKETSPTLVEFQNTEAQLPEWRLQLKNAVLKRRGESQKIGVDNNEANSQIALAPSNTYQDESKNNISPEVFEEKQPESFNRKQLAKALQRIERSREKFYVIEPEVEKKVSEQPKIEKAKSTKEFPFTIASRNENPQVETNEETKDSVNFPSKPQLVPKQKTKTNVNLYDTSELDPKFISAKIASSFEKTAQKIEKPEITNKIDTSAEINTEIKTETIKEDLKAEIKVEPKEEIQTNEVDDVAPFSLRFNAGCFDLIVGSVSSMILLAPFILLGGEWLSVTGGFAFLATCSIVMFIYMTTTIGLFGKTFGMHLFTLEMIDYFDDEYPTFHQAAVSSSIYLLSIGVFGLGFITSIFDEDKRAVHDLVSGTIIVREL